MDTREAKRDLIQKIISAHAAISYAHGDIRRIPIFDRENDHYLLVIAGREGIRRVHGCIIHVDIIDGKFWVQRDGTEYGVAGELADAGIPKDQIVLGMYSKERRELGEFAVA